MWNEVWGVWVGTVGKEISIKQGAAESRPEELRWQYPDSGSLTKQCVLNAKTPAAAPSNTTNHPICKRLPYSMEMRESLQQVEKRL